MLPRITIGPIGAIIIGLGAMIGTGNGDRILPGIHSATGALVGIRGLLPAAESAKGGESGTGSDFLAAVNARVEKAVAELKSLVRPDQRGMQPIIIRGDDGADWTLTAVKCLLMGGAALGVCHILGIDVWRVLGVTGRTVEATVRGISHTMGALQRGCAQGLGAVTDLLGRYRGDVRRVQEETRDHLDAVDSQVADVRQRAAEVSDTVDRMQSISERSNTGLQLLCHALAAHLPRSNLQRSLEDYAGGARQRRLPPPSQ